MITPGPGSGSGCSDCLKFTGWQADECLQGLFPGDWDLTGAQENVVTDGLGARYDTSTQMREATAQEEDMSSLCRDPARRRCCHQPCYLDINPYTVYS